MTCIDQHMVEHALSRSQIIEAQSIVCICSTGECVSVNFGQHPFKFSVEAMIQEEDERQDAAVQR